VTLLHPYLTFPLPPLLLNRKSRRKRKLQAFRHHLLSEKTCPHPIFRHHLLRHPLILPRMIVPMTPRKWLSHPLHLLHPHLPAQWKA
jgi:hypothetical protein